MQHLEEKNNDTKEADVSGLPVTDNSPFSLLGLILSVSLVVMVIILLQTSSIFFVAIF
jgi:hypothetical protein